MLPHSPNPYASSAKRGVRSAIARLVPLKLRNPIVLIGLRPAPVPRALVPEAPIHENGEPESREIEVGLSWEVNAALDPASRKDLAY